MIDLQVLFVPYSSDGTTTNDCTYSQSNLLPFRIHHYQRLLHHLPSYISSRYLNQLQLKSTFPHYWVLLPYHQSPKLFQPLHFVNQFFLIFFFGGGFFVPLFISSSSEWPRFFLNNYINISFKEIFIDSVEKKYLQIRVALSGSLFKTSLRSRG